MIHNTLRYKFLRFLHRRVFKVKQGQVSHKAVRFLYRVLFPVKSEAERIYGITYDCGTDFYTIEGVKVTGAFFRCFRIPSNFKAIRENDNITIIRNEP